MGQHLGEARLLPASGRVPDLDLLVIGIPSLTPLGLTGLLGGVRDAYGCGCHVRCRPFRGFRPAGSGRATQTVRGEGARGKSLRRMSPCRGWGSDTAGTVEGVPWVKGGPGRKVNGGWAGDSRVGLLAG